MSASSQSDIFAEVWKRSVAHKLDTGADLDISHPKKPPRVSIFATRELAHAEKPFLTWKPELMLCHKSVPDVPKIRQTLVDLIPGDNFEQLEKVYQYEYAAAELEEYHEVRLEKAKTQLEEWKHIADDCRVRFDSLNKTGGDYVAVAWHEAILDRAQGRVIRWTKIVAQEQEEVQRQKSKVDELNTSASEAIALFKQRHDEPTLKQRQEPAFEQRSSADVGWCASVYLFARENPEIRVSGPLTTHAAD